MNNKLLVLIGSAVSAAFILNIRNVSIHYKKFPFTVIRMPLSSVALDVNPQRGLLPWWAMASTLRICGYIGQSGLVLKGLFSGHNKLVLVLSFYMMYTFIEVHRVLLAWPCSLTLRIPIVNFHVELARKHTHDILPILDTSMQRFCSVMWFKWHICWKHNLTLLQSFQCSEIPLKRWDHILYSPVQYYQVHAWCL